MFKRRCFAFLTWLTITWASDDAEARVSALHFKQRNCSETCSYRTDSALLLDENTYVERLIKAVHDKGLDLVSSPRKRVTVLLTKAAVASCVPGAVVETGVYTGGTSIVIMKTLMDFDRCDRVLWTFDSFEGLPEVGAEDTNGTLNQGVRGEFSATQMVFEDNLKALHAWDHRIRVVKGWFNETIPPLKHDIGPIAFLRLDGDLFTSTFEVLNLLYDQLNHGGVIYVDDYGSFTGCRRAVDKFRAMRKIWEPLHDVYERGGEVEAVWWRHFH